MKTDTEQDTVNFLVECIYFEKCLEKGKHELALKPDFNLCDAFRIFDEKECGYISQTDFKNGLADIGLSISHDEIELFFRRYDRDGDALLAFSEFSEAFTPYESYYASIIGRRTSSHKRINPYKKDDIFEHATGVQLREFLRQSFQLEKSAETMRSTIARNPCFLLEDSFKICDLNGNGIVSKDELRMLLESCGHRCSDSDARRLLQRFDRNDDGIILWDEFVDEVRPKVMSRHLV